MNASGKCSAPDCERPSVASIELRSLCLLHFIDTSYVRLDALTQSIRALSVGGSESESARTFLHECIQTATSFSQQSPELSNLDRARLLDILFWATELDRRFLRSSNTH